MQTFKSFFGTGTILATHYGYSAVTRKPSSISSSSSNTRKSKFGEGVGSLYSMGLRTNLHNDLIF